jgi:hypothetical protein
MIALILPVVAPILFAFAPVLDSLKTVVSWSDENHFKTERFTQDPASGQESKMMEILAQRK